MTDPILDAIRHDTDDLLRKLGTVASTEELDGFRDGLKRNPAEPPAEVVHAIARKRIDLQRNQPKGRKNGKRG